MAREYIESLLLNPRTEIIEHEVLLPDGTLGWQQWVDHVIVGPDGKVKELQGIGRDITDRKRAEELLKKKEEALRESHARIEDLAGRLLAAQETERARIGQELHDDLDSVSPRCPGVSKRSRGKYSRTALSGQNLPDWPHSRRTSAPR